MAEVSAALQPHTLLERLEVNERCQALWEEQRFRRQQAALPVATGVKALVCLLASNGFKEDTLFDIASGYFCEDGDEPTKAAALLRCFHITDDAINAQASTICKFSHCWNAFWPAGNRGGMSLSADTTVVSARPINRPTN